LGEALLKLRHQDLIWGVIILSTCNRMEIYIHSLNNNSSLEKIERFLINCFQVWKEDIKSYFYMLEDIDAIKHIFRVASGLDSQVLGETQILGQVKSAWSIAKEKGVSGDFLDNIFEKAIEAGKLVRSQTKISQGNVSIGSVAIKMLKDYFRKLQDKLVLIIGAGKISRLMSEYLKEQGAKSIFVSNRTYIKACALASECAGEPINFDRLKEKLKTVDIVISSTASPHLILKRETLEEVMQTRRKPLFILDLAVARDIDPEAKDIDGVSLYDLDSLKYVIEENYNKRKREIGFTEEIIQKELDQLLVRDCFA
ncbi:MAG: glutamyl-tRNA reductase, partial [Omnitrophica bacterium]|nr:glutamyl-tRNA reductase [Candidatus Omnitrophota bacterium]